MIRILGMFAAMAIPVAHADGAGPVRHAHEAPIEVCEALPDDVPIEQSLVTDPTVARQAIRTVHATRRADTDR